MQVKTAVRQTLVEADTLGERENNSGYIFSWGFIANELSEGQSTEKGGTLCREILERNPS